MALIELGKKVNKKIYTIVDDKDFEYLNKIRWNTNHKNQVRGKNPATDKLTFMHRLLTNAKDGEIVDHINHDTLDNRRSNLRICTQQQNIWNRRKQKINTSGYLGVTREIDDKYWWYRASVKYDSKRVFSFNSKDIIECAYVYDQVIMQLRGEFALTNFGGYDES